MKTSVSRNLLLVLLGANVLQLILANDTAECPQQSPRAVGNFNRTPNKLHIYFDFQFQCDGWVSQYHFYAKRTGTFFVGTWRQQGDTDQWTNMGYNEIVVTETGEQTVDIDPIDRIMVKATDAIGIHYNRAARGVIPQATKLYIGEDFDTTYSSFHKSQHTMDNITEGFSVHVQKKKFTRTIALNAVVVEDTPLICNSSLIHDEDYRIPESAITASSYYTGNSLDCHPRNILLWDDDSVRAWCSANNNAGQWLRVDFNDGAQVTGIMLKARPVGGQWVSQYTLECYDGDNWISVNEQYPDGSQGAQLFDGTSAEDVPVYRKFNMEFLYCYSIKFYPIQYEGWISTRLDIRGC